MSKYHTIKLDGEFIVRDLTMPPFKKKVRIAPIELKWKILEKLYLKDNMLFLNYINSRIHFFVDKNFIHKEEDEIINHLERNVHTFKNDIIIDLQQSDPNSTTHPDPNFQQKML